MLVSANEATQDPKCTAKANPLEMTITMSEKEINNQYCVNDVKYSTFYSPQLNVKMGCVKLHAIELKEARREEKKGSAL